MFIQTEATPDPARLKFLPGREVLAGGTLDVHDEAQAAHSPLAKRLFAIPGISAVSLGKDFITITKAGGEWQHLKPAILGSIMEYFMSEAPVLRGETTEGEANMLERIRDALRQVIDPELGYNLIDLGLIYDVTIESGGEVRVTMTTTTRGCPATDYLREGVWESVRAVPGIASVEVNLTYDPRWVPEMMSPQAKAHFGISD